jgi:hypothetical protein
MSDFFTVNLSGGFRHVNLDQVKYFDQEQQFDGCIVTLHFGPGDDLKLEGGEGRRFLNEWDNRWRKALAAKAA